MKLKKLVFIISILFFAVSLFGQAKITKYPDAMFWKIEGTDAKGNPSELYVLGTIHVGDERLFPLPDVVENAWKTADVRVCEISSAEWATLEPTLQQMIIKSASNAFKLKRNLKKELTEDEIEILYEVNPMLQYTLGFEPWVVNQSLSEFIIAESGLKADFSYDSYFIKRAQEENLELEGLDTLQVQLNVITFGDWDFQLKQLKAAIADLENEDPVDQLYELYETYLTHNAEEFECTYAVQELEDESEDEEYAELIQALLLDRNKVWVEKFQDYLLKGGKTFIFAGTGHFVGENSVFKLMKEKGYLSF